MIVPAERKPDLDKYEVFEEIGHGGMATVYRGYDRRLEREVAIKIIHRHLRDSREVSARFVSEAKAVAMVKHPNIVEVYDVSDPDEDERYLVVELVRACPWSSPYSAPRRAVNAPPSDEVLDPSESLL